VAGPQKQLFPVSFQGGIDTKTDPRQVIPGKLLDLQNGIFQQTGAINRRWGYTALGTGIIGGLSNITAAAAIDGRFNNELILYDGTYGYSYIAADNAWANRGEVVSVIQTNQQIIRNSSQQLSPDSAALGGIQVYAWEDSRGGIRYSIIDQASSAFVVVDQLLFATGSRPKCIPCVTAGVIGIFFNDGFGNLQVAGVKTTEAASSPVVTQLISGLTTPISFDVQPAPTGTIFLAAWSNTGLPPPGFAHTLSMYTVTMTGIPSVSAVNPGAVQSSGIVPVCSPSLCVDPVSGGGWLIYAPPSDPSAVVAGSFNSAGAGFFIFNTIFSGLSGITLSVTGIVAAGNLTAFAEVQGASGNLILSNTITSGNALGYPASSAPVFIRGCGLASKAFTYAGKVYVNVATQSQQQSTYFTLDTTGNVVAKAVGQLGGGYVSSSDYVLPNVNQLSTGVFQYTNLVKGIVNTEAGVVQSLLGVNSTKLDFFDSNSYLSSNLNGEMYVVGGILQRYDGAAFTEVGFHMYPEAIGYTAVLSGGAMADGIYGYSVTYEWIDNLGNTEISTPSIVNYVTISGGGGAGSVQIVIPTLRLTKKSNVRLVVYRTTGAGGTTGPVLYRVTSALLPTYNSTAIDTVTFTDTLSDASITSNGAMYTQPLTVGQNPILPNAAPPSCAFITTFANRLVIAGGDLSSSLWYSQTAISGAPAQFSALLQLVVDPDGGPITALARMDDKLIIFKQTGIFYITGQGPDATGAQSDFGTPIQIPSAGVGCYTSNSICLMPTGLLFQSLNGIFLLDRSLNVTYKGAPVEQYTLPSARNLTITSATLVPNQWVIFTTSSGLALVYDYYYDQWSTFTNHPAFDSDCWIGGGNLFVWANASTGVVYKQTLGAYLDNGAAIPFSLTTSWLTFNALAGVNSGMQSYARVYHALLVGQYYNAHTLQVNVAYDYDSLFSSQVVTPVFSTTASINAATATGQSTYGAASPFGSDTPFGGSVSGAAQYQFRLDLLRKCQAVAFQIQDNGSSAGQGFSLSALSLVVGVKQGANKLPAIKQFGVT
jgi:hypothetical protein